MAASRFSSLIVFLAVAWLGVHCSSPAPAEPTPVEPVITTAVFTGSLDPGASQFHPFTTVAAGTAAATLASLIDTSGLVLSIPLTVELGTVSEDTLSCVALANVQTRPSLMSATSLTVGTGSYCVRIADTGGLTTRTTYTLRVVHATSSEAATAAAVTETFSSTVVKRGATSRSFITTAPGMITIALTSLSQDTAFVGLALGLSDELTGVCARTYAIVTQVYSARALSANADQGRYCVVVYDVGDFTDTVTFTVSVTHF